MTTFYPQRLARLLAVHCIFGLFHPYLAPYHSHVIQAKPYFRCHPLPRYQQELSVGPIPESSSWPSTICRFYLFNSVFTSPNLFIPMKLMLCFHSHIHSKKHLLSTTCQVWCSLLAPHFCSSYSSLCSHTSPPTTSPPQTLGPPQRSPQIN